MVVNIVVSGTALQAMSKTQQEFPARTLSADVIIGRNQTITGGKDKGFCFQQLLFILETLVKILASYHTTPRLLRCFGWCINSPAQSFTLQTSCYSRQGLSQIFSQKRWFGYPSMSGTN